MGPGNHNQDTDLGVNITNIKLEERGNSGTWGGFADSCTDIRYYLSDRDMKRYEIGESNPNSAVGVKPYLDSPVIVARCPNAMMHHTTHHWLDESSLPQEMLPLDGI